MPVIQEGNEKPQQTQADDDGIQAKDRVGIRIASPEIESVGDKKTDAGNGSRSSQAIDSTIHLTSQLLFYGKEKHLQSHVLDGEKHDLGNELAHVNGIRVSNQQGKNRSKQKKNGKNGSMMKRKRFKDESGKGRILRIELSGWPELKRWLTKKI